MANNARRKERNRLKREKKKADNRRAASLSPYKRIGRPGETVACYVNADWQIEGMAAIYVIRKNPAGAYALAGFVIDLWCAGLKDAWVKLDLFDDDINGHLNYSRKFFDLIRIDLDAARSLIAGSIRFARQNGFRLPAHYNRWINVLGDVGDIASADLHGFGRNGKLAWIGPIDDLRRRLVACTAEEFLARPDVDHLTVDDEFDQLEPSVDNLNMEEFIDLVQDHRARINATADQFSKIVRDRCARSNEPLPPFLDDAVRALIALTLLEGADEVASRQENDQADDIDEAALCAAQELLQEILGDAINDDGPTPLDRSMDQVEQIIGDIAAQIGTDEEFAKLPKK